MPPLDKASQFRFWASKGSQVFNVRQMRCGLTTKLLGLPRLPEELERQERANPGTITSSSLIETDDLRPAPVHTDKSKAASLTNSLGAIETTVKSPVPPPLGGTVRFSFTLSSSP
jgi:hypothetical protein